MKEPVSTQSYLEEEGSSQAGIPSQIFGEAEILTFRMRIAASAPLEIIRLSAWQRGIFRGSVAIT